jgi:hypothetical protein
MAFVYPGILWLLSLISIPIIIHLFHFRRFKTLYFSSLQFIQKIDQENKSTKKLKHLIVLITRILALSAIIIAFAQPYLPVKNGGANAGKNLISIYIDNSFSMTAKGVEGELLSEAREIARKTIQDAPIDCRILLHTNNLSGIEKRILTKFEALAQLDKIKEGPITRNIDEIINWEREFITRINREQERISSVQHLIISDFQKETFKTSKLTSDNTGFYYPIQLKAQSRANLYIDSIYFASPLQKLGEPNEVFVRVNNDSDEDAINVEIKIELGSQKRTMFAEIKANSNFTTSFNYTNIKPGVFEGSAEIKDKQLFWDDSYFFNITVAKACNVLLINGALASEDIKKVFSIEPFYKLTSIAELSYTSDLAAQADLIILNGINDVSSGLANDLIELSEQGHSIALFPGDNIVTASWNTFLAKLNLPLLGNTISTGNTINAIDYKNPFFMGMFDKEKADLNLPSISKSYSVLNANQSAAYPLLKQRNGNPLLLKSPGNNSNYLYTSSLALSFGNFTQNAIFPAILLRMGELSARKLPPFVTIGQDAKILIHKSSNTEKPLRLVNKTVDFIPQHQRFKSIASISISGAEAIEKLVAGSYQLIDEEEIGRLAINYDRKESSTEIMEGKQIIQAFENAGIKNCTFKTIENGQSNTQLKLDKPFEYWRYFVILALLFIVIEMILLKFWK